MSTTSNRSKLQALLAADPSLAAELAKLLGVGGANEQAAELPREFVGRLADPMVSPKSGKSVKYDGEAVIGGHKAIVVVYLSPEVATEAIDFELKLDGAKAKPRQPKRRS